MNEVMEKTFLVIDEIEKSDIIKDISLCKEKIMANGEIMNLIKMGQDSCDDYYIMEIRKKLFTYTDYYMYMDCYNKLMYIVMKINHKYLSFTDTKSCCSGGVS